MKARVKQDKEEPHSVGRTYRSEVGGKDTGQEIEPLVPPKHLQLPAPVPDDGVLDTACPMWT